MFTVTFVHLAPDLRSAKVDFASMTFKDVSEAQIAAALEVFRQIEPVQNSEAEPHVIIESPAVKLLVRTGQGKFFVYNARNLSEPFSELEPDDILRELSRRNTGHEAASDTDAPAAPPSLRRRHRSLAFAIIALALALDGYSVFAFLRVHPAVARPSVTLVTDPQVVEGARHAAAGRYTTGNEPGDRVIEIAADGHVSFFRLASSGQRTVAQDAYRVAQRDNATCLVTSAGRLIEIQNIYTITYCRDTYRRR